MSNKDHKLIDAILDFNEEETLTYVKEMRSDGREPLDRLNVGALINSMLEHGAYR